MAALLLTACNAVATTSTEQFSETGELVALSGGGAGARYACFTCHGLDGSGDGAGSPRLAGLNVGYLERQLEAYADGRRAHVAMEWVAHHLSPVERKTVSAYYAGMAWEPEGAPAGAAPALYLRGDPSRGILACASCHGVRGQGLGPANPPLAGQPAAYLEGQLQQWRRAKRRNDPGNVMLRISQLLTPSEASRLSAYASSLPGDSPSRALPEASPQARRADPRNDASGPPRRGPAPGS